MTLFLVFMLSVITVLVNSPPVNATDAQPAQLEITCQDAILVHSNYSFIAAQKELPYIREGEYVLLYATSAVIYDSFALRFTGPLTILICSGQKVTALYKDYTELGYSMAY